MKGEMEMEFKERENDRVKLQKVREVDYENTFNRRLIFGLFDSNVAP